MIKLCPCGARETIQPYGDARTLNGPCTACRKKFITKSLITKRSVITRTEAVSIVSRIKFR